MDPGDHVPAHPPGERPGEPPGDGSWAGHETDLAMVLAGNLPCIGCGYDIKGLSVLSPCPECGLAVRATILARVDPHAHALRPMPTPWLTSIGVLLWTAGGLAAAVMLWLPRLADLADELSAGRVTVGTDWARPLALASIAVSGLGALGLVRPVRDQSAWRTVAGLGAIACYVPLFYGVYRAAELEAVVTPYVSSSVLPERVWWRLLAGMSTMVALLLIRPSARELVKRSLVMRTRRVDRQTIMATAGALAVAALGDVLRLLSAAGSGPTEWLGLVGSILVLVGSVLVTLALMGASLDSWRIAHSILIPSPTPRDALRRSGP